MQRPSNWAKARPPLPSQKGWKKIVKFGCQGTRDYWGEFDCVYPWACEDCPVLQEAEQKAEEGFIGPPEPNNFIFD